MIIGLSGYARAGKDTVADRLVASHGYTKIGFADALKDAAYALDPLLSKDEFDMPIYLSEHVDAVGWERAKETAEVRRILQRLGTEVGRNLFGEDFWVDVMAEKIRERYYYDTPTEVRDEMRVVIPDCRFPNEAAWVQGTVSSGQRRGEVWRITRPGFAPVNPHPSETALDDWKFDCHVMNDKTVAALHEHVDYLVEALL